MGTSIFVVCYYHGKYNYISLQEFLQNHPNSVGFWNRSFSFYDKLDYIYEKDSYWRRCRKPADAIEEIDLQEPDQRGHNELSTPLIVLGEVGSEQEETNRTTPNPSTHSAHTTHVAPSSNENKRRKIGTLEVIQEFSSQMDRLGNLMATAREHITMLANCFKHESKGAERRMTINGELIKIERLSQQEIIKVRRKIVLDIMETDYFFSIS